MGTDAMDEVALRTERNRLVKSEMARRILDRDVAADCD
jgi:hypothetical protein